MGFEDFFWGRLREGCDAGYTLDPWDKMTLVEGATCTLPVQVLRIPSMVILVFGSVNCTLSMVCFAKFVWLKTYVKYPVDVAFMFSICISVGAGQILTFGWPGQITNLETLAVPCAFGWLVHMSVMFTLVIFSSSVQAPLRAVVVLDPIIEQALDRIFKGAAVINFLVGIAWPYSLLSFAAATTEEAMDNTAKALGVAVLIWASNLSIAVAATYTTLMYLPPSAQAYAEEFPAFKKQLNRLRLMLLVMGGFTVVVAVFTFPLVIWVIPRYFYTCCDVIVAVFQVVDFNFIYSCYSFHTDQLSQRLPRQTRQTVSVAQSTTAGKGESEHRISAAIKDGTIREDTTVEVSKRGVSVQFLRQFASEFGIGKHETTYSVQKRLVKEHTRGKGCSYYSMLGDGKDKYGHKWSSCNQTVFVSHSWGCSFESLIRVCAEHEEKQHKEDSGQRTYFYIDIFVMNQWEIDGKKSTGDEDVVYRALLQTLDDSIAFSDTVLVVLNEYSHPEALTRIWCLFEIYRCISLSKQLKMGFPRSEANRFASAVNNLDISIDDLARSVDVSTAEATDSYDLGMIRRNIERTIGEDRFNATLRKKLMAHLVDCAISTKVDHFSKARARHGNRNRVSPHHSALDTDDTTMYRVNKALIERCAELERRVGALERGEQNRAMQIQKKVLREQNPAKNMQQPMTGQGLTIGSAEVGPDVIISGDSEIDKLYGEMHESESETA